MWLAFWIDQDSEGKYRLCEAVCKTNASSKAGKLSQTYHDYCSGEGGIVYRSTAKQRLWLSCLGYDASETTTSDDAESMFEDAKSSGRYHVPATESQRRVGASLDISFNHEATCYDMAGRLYELLLLRGWVYSVCRVLLGSNADDTLTWSLPTQL